MNLSLYTRISYEEIEVYTLCFFFCLHAHGISLDGLFVEKLNTEQE